MISSPAGAPAEVSVAAGGRRRRDRLAGWLFRHRGSTAVPFAFLAVIGARPSPAGMLAGTLLMGSGEWLRLAAASAIGPHSRGLSLRAPKLVTSGPYAVMRHPLYVGNGLLCAGLLVFSGAFIPWLPLIFMPLFMVQYGLFIAREEQYVATQWGSEWLQYCRQVPWIAFPISFPRRCPVTASGWKLEWPTCRTVIFLAILIIASGLVRRQI